METLTMATNGKAQKHRSTFRLEYSVSIAIRASPERVWSLLTDAAGFPGWNSTVKSIAGTIGSGQTIQLRTTATPDRVFNLKINEFDPPRRLVWRDGTAPMFSGVRTFSLAPGSNSSTTFTMVEVLAGLMLPMIAGSLPDFVPVFERYAADLKAAAER
jgi:uncharacterized protein YndB with AHSA1/START domain